MLSIFVKIDELQMFLFGTAVCTTIPVYCPCLKLVKE